MFYLWVVVFGTFFINFGTAHVLFRGRHIQYFFDVVSQTSVNSYLQPKAMAKRTRDGGVEECKGFSPPNVQTTSASSTRLPLGSLDLNTRVPNTSIATPQRPRRTESQRSADLARKRARCAQRTGKQRLHIAQEKRTSGASFLQHLGAVSPVTGEHGICAPLIRPYLCISSRGCSVTCRRTSLTSSRGCDLGVANSAGSGGLPPRHPLRLRRWLEGNTRAIAASPTKKRLSLSLLPTAWALDLYPANSGVSLRRRRYSSPKAVPSCVMSVHIYVSLVRRRVKTPTPHYINTCVKLTIVTYLSFSERIAIANCFDTRTLPLFYVSWLSVEASRHS